FLAQARADGAGVLLLVRTSNPGAADIEDLPLEGGGTVWERTAALVQELGSDGVGEAGISDVGAVMGATAPWHLERARELMPSAVFLLPGIGAEGGGVEEQRAAFEPGPTAPWHLQPPRALMPSALFLLPGIGAPGGRVEEQRAAFEPGPAGGLV